MLSYVLQERREVPVVTLFKAKWAMSRGESRFSVERVLPGGSDSVWRESSDAALGLLFIKLSGQRLYESFDSSPNLNLFFGVEPVWDGFNREKCLWQCRLHVQYSKTFDVAFSSFEVFS